MIEILATWANGLGLSVKFVLLSTRVPLEVWLIGVGVVGGIAVVAAMARSGNSASPESPSSPAAPSPSEPSTDWMYQPMPQKGRRRALPGKRTAAKAGAISGDVDDVDDVDVTVCAPPLARCTETVMIQVFIHKEEVSRLVDRARQRDPDAELLGSTDLDLPLRRDDEIRVQIDPGMIRCKGPRVVRRMWTGETEKLSFLLEMPAEPQIIKPRVDVFVEGVRAGSIAFKVEAALAVPDAARAARDSSLRQVAREAQASKISKAFLSYASPDRPFALRAAQVLSRLKVEYFQDVLSLEPGERWEKALYRNIEQCDVFLLFWSHYAKESEWVMREVTEAVRERTRRQESGSDLAISPIIVEGPPIVPPPEVLADLHMNDPLQHVIFAEEMSRRYPGEFNRSVLYR